MNAQTSNPVLDENIKALENEEHLISETRKEELSYLSSEIKRQISELGKSDVIFVCTHNSRRSQLAELWLRAAAKYYNIKNVSTWSGGTEATAFNQRMVDAVVRIGFYITKDNQVKNPGYHVRLNDEDSGLKMFSKKYDNLHNPQTGFIAVMVCGQADKDCPFVQGAFARIALPYEDPKKSDDTPQETLVYDAKVKEIGREILFMSRLLKNEL